MIPVILLLISGHPIREEIAWSGPIVMNNHEELKEAFDELQKIKAAQHQKIN